MDPSTGTARERDGVSSLRDVQGEAGDEAEIEDLFSLDVTEAKALGVELDDRHDETRPS